MQPTTLLPILIGLLFATVGGYFFLFRPLDRRTLLLAVTLLFNAVGLSFAFWTTDVTTMRLAVLAADATFFGFVALFPRMIPWRSVSAVALLLACCWWIASLVGLAFGGYSRNPFGSIDNIQVQLLGPGSTGNTIVFGLIVFARIFDLRKDIEPAGRATLYLLLGFYAQVLTGAGFHVGRLISRAWQDLPLLGTSSVELQVLHVILWYAVPIPLALFAGIRCGWLVPVWLIVAGFVSSIPFMATPSLGETGFILQVWGFILGPAFVMYAQAKWDALPGEPRGIAPTIAVTAFASLFTYGFIAVFASIALPPSEITDLVVPILGILAAIGTAFLVLPRARRMDLSRLLAARTNGPLAPGAVVLGRYRVTRLIGEGGQARVYEAEETRKPHRRVVLKAVSNHEGLQEAKILQGLAHPNIVRFIDVVEVPGSTLIVLEFAPGGTLRGLLNRRGGHLAPAEAQRIADGVLSGLAAAHAAGVTHRDVKAENILLGTEGVPMLADFGIARAPDAGNTLRPGSSGTLAYMAPEQVRGEPGDERSDVYAAAILVHELLTGKPPIETEPGDEFRTRKAILTRAPKLALPPSAKSFTNMLQRALAKDPASRPQHAAAFRASLMPAWPNTF